MDTHSTPDFFTIGFLTSNLTSKLSRDLLEGIEMVVNGGWGNVICFSGDLLEPADQPSEHSFANAIYDLAAIKRLDGLIIYGGDIGQHITVEDLSRFCRKFQGIPLVNIAARVPGITSILIDNYTGMFDLVEHVITEHHYETIGFVKGPEGHDEAEVRFKAFVDALEKYGLQPDAEFITSGDFSLESGKKSIEYYLDEKKQLPGIIIAADDDTAIGAYQELQRRGIRVPEECAVTGFDDTAMGNTLLNPLTTVHQPIIEQGRAAAQYILDRIQQKPVVEKITIRTKKIIRRSCGCYESFSPAPQHTQQHTFFSHDMLISEFLKLNRDSHLFASDTSIYALVKSFHDAAETGNDTLFLDALQSIHTDLNPENDFIFNFQEFISIFREYINLNETLAGQRDFLEILLHKARIIINQIAERRKSYLQYQAIEKYTSLGYINSLLNTTSSWETLSPVLSRIATEYFSDLEIASFFICLYVDPKHPLNQSRLLFSYSQNVICDDESAEAAFETSQILPDKYRHIVGKNIVLNPLYFGHEHIGYTVIYTPVQNSFICDILSWQYSSALIRIKLFLQMKQRTQEAEESLRRLQETQRELVEAEKMASLGTLITGVAHEINTPLGAGVTYSSFLQDITNTIQSKFNGDALKKSDLQKYLNDALEASKGILFNLNRAAELVHSFKNIAVDRIAQDRRRFNVKEYINDILLSMKSTLKKTPHTITVYCDEHLEITSFPGVFSQIMLNFLMNSLTHGFEPGTRGTITISVKKENRACVLVYSDNGKGMDPDTFKKIFDPFFTTKRGKGGSGLGLYIVYNLVTKTLQGTIDCMSEFGKGTCFMIRCPLES